MNQSSYQELLSLPYKGHWFVARQTDGYGYMICELGAQIEEDKWGATVIEVDLAQVDADALCCAHNAKGRAVTQ